MRSCKLRTFRQVYAAAKFAIFPALPENRKNCKVGDFSLSLFVRYCNFCTVGDFSLFFLSLTKFARIA